MAVITGTIQAVDTHQALLINDSLRTGALTGIDNTHSAILEGLVLQDSSRLATAPEFVQGDLLGPNDLSLTLLDSTFIDGSYSGDGTYFDSTYSVRWFTPVSLNYSIWYMSPPDRSDSTLIGTRTRTAIESNVGQFYANMVAPDPGDYEIRWRYLKDADSFGHEIVEPFSVTTLGISPQPDYTGAS